MSSCRVLLVDPDPADRELLALVLSATVEYQPVAIDDAISLAGELADGRYAALIFEQWLDWTDAPRLLEAVKRRQPECAVVLFTAAPDPETIHAALGHGLDGVVIKSSAGYRRLPAVLDEIFARRARGVPSAGVSPRAAEAPTPPPSSSAPLAPFDPSDELFRPGRGDHDPPGEVEELARVVAHDLKAPLQQIERYSRLLADRFGSQLGPRGGQYVHHLVEASRRLQEMIDEIVDYSQVGTGGRAFRQVNLEEVLAEVLENLAPALEASGGQVTHEPLPAVPGDRAGLVRLLQNLVDNALKFHGDAAPEVRIAAERRPDGWDLTVRDNGIGIPEKDHERIFSMFGRLHTAQEYPGSGVGLAVCRRIAERHGGTIRIESTPGEGTTFIVRLPETAVEEAS